MVWIYNEENVEQFKIYAEIPAGVKGDDKDLHLFLFSHQTIGTVKNNLNELLDDPDTICNSLPDYYVMKN